MSTPNSIVRRRVVTTPRATQDLHLRMGHHEGGSGLPSLGPVSPLTELLAPSPSQMQALTPDRPGRQPTPLTANAPANWTLSANLPSTSSRCRSQAPPALDIVSPLTMTGAAGSVRQSTNGYAQGSLPELQGRKDGVHLASLDGSTERCALSPSSLSAGRSLAYTPTSDTTVVNGPSTVGVQQPPRVSLATDSGVTPPPNAPRGYLKRNTCSREGVGALHRPAAGSALRMTTTSNLLDSPPRSSAEEPTPLPTPHPVSVEVLHLGRLGESSGDLDYSRAGRSLSDCGGNNSYTLPSTVMGQQGRGGDTHFVATPGSAHHVRGTSAAAAAAALTMSGSGVVSAPPVRLLASPLSASTPHLAIAGSGGTAQTNSILATGAAGAGATAVSTTTVGASGSKTKANRAPRLTSQLFTAEASPDSAAPTSSLQSPSMMDVIRRRASRGSSGRSPRSHGSSGSTSSSPNAVTPLCATLRPTAASFARGELIGKGSFGTVYRGMQRNNNRIICMKEIRLPGAAVVAAAATATVPPPSESSACTPPKTSPGAVTSPPGSPGVEKSSTKEEAVVAKQMDSVKRELAVLKKLNHPNIVKYLNDEVVDGCLHLYMEYVSGGSVSAVLKTYGAFEEPQAAALCYQLLQGLTYLHRRGIVHRDLKGDNLLLETSSELKIADFGTAKNIIVSATMTANIVGTAYFMAPEVLRLDGVVGTASDIWSAGCCVIEMLTTKPPLSDIPNQYGVMMAIAGSPKVPLDKYIPRDNNWSSEVLDFIAQCLQVSPTERPTAQELLKHPWITKYCDADSSYLTTATTGTTNAVTAPFTAGIPSIGRPTSAVPARDRGTLPTSPEAVTPTFAHSSDASPAKERRPKKEKRSAATKRSSKEGEPRSAGTRPQLSPSSSPGRWLRQLGPDISSVPPTMNLVARGQLNEPFGGSPTSKEDARPISFANELPSLVPGRGADPLTPAGSFLPALPGTASSSGATASPSLVMSTDFLRGINALNALSAAGGGGGRIARHAALTSSREETRAYHYPHSDECGSRGSVDGGRGFPSERHELSREVTEGTVRYGSAARIGLAEDGVESGVYSTYDGPSASGPGSVLGGDGYSRASATESRRSASKRLARGDSATR